MLEEQNCVILTSKPIPKLRYKAHARKYKPFLHVTESLKHDSIEIISLLMADKHNCLILTS